MMSNIVLPSGVELRPIPVSPNDDYMAGDDGNIYSRTRYAGFGKKYRCDWYVLKGGKTSKGYRSISLCHNGKKVTKSIHRLICMAFHGMPQNNTMQVRHLDGDPGNNRPQNLAWGTQYENWQDRIAHGRGMEGEKHHAAKLTDREREHIKWAIGKGLCSMRHTARVLGLSEATISEVCKK